MKKILYIGLVLAALGLAACGGGSSDVNTITILAPVPAEYVGQSNPLGADAATEGGKVFTANCESCHGPEGHGDGPAGVVLDPQPKNLAQLQKIAADDYLYWRINTGKEGTAMVPWKGVLTNDQIWQVIAYINTLK